MKLTVGSIGFVLICAVALPGCYPWPHFVTVVPEVHGLVVQSGEAKANAAILTQVGSSETPCEAGRLVTRTNEHGSFTITSQSRFRLFVEPLVDPISENEWQFCIEKEGRLLLGLTHVNSQARTASIRVSCDTHKRFPQNTLTGWPAKDGTCQVVSVGNIKGIKVSIPHYLLTGLRYKDEEKAGAERTEPARNFDSEIKEFSLFLSLPPLQDEMDVQYWVNYVEQGPREPFRRGNRRFTISYSSDEDMADGGQLQGIWEQYMKKDSQLTQFIVHDDKMYGLKHGVFIERGEAKISDPRPAEILYDAITWKTVITCSENPLNTAPPFALYSNCIHLFVAPEINAVAKVHYPKEDLPHWQKVENILKRIANTLVVE